MAKEFDTPCALLSSLLLNRTFANLVLGRPFEIELSTSCNKLPTSGSMGGVGFSSRIVEPLSG